MPLVFPTTPIASRQRHDPVELALRDVNLAAADLMTAILHAETVGACLTLSRQVEVAVAIFTAVGSAALERANTLLRERER